MRTALSLLLSLVLIPPGCGGTDVETRVVDSGTGGSGTGAGTSSTGPGTTVGNTGGDTGGDTGTGAGTGGTETTGGETSTGTGSAGLGTKCGIAGHPGLAIGEPCLDHEDCETGYCYDEELWNEDGSQTYKFCTAACTGCTTVTNCNKWGKAAGVTENKCNPLPSYFTQHYGLQLDSLCLASCTSDANCAELGPYSKCARLRFGKDTDYGVVKICQPPDFPKLPEDEF